MSRYLFAMILVATQVMADPVCTVGELVAGTPEFNDPAQRAAEGQGLRDVPPLGWRSLLFVGDRLVTAVGQEVWYSNLHDSRPILHRLAGREDRRSRSSKFGPCVDARFANIGGLSLLADGSIAGTDQSANNIFSIRDPFGPSCSVSSIAGASISQSQMDPDRPANLGDKDGPGSGALLRFPDWIASGAGGIYFIDEGNSKLKRVSTDAVHTVKTIARLPEGAYYALVSLNDKLYAIANNTNSEAFILEIAASSGAVRELVRGPPSTWESSGAINVSGLATDGRGLFTSQSGKLLYVTLAGSVKAIAGTGTYFDTPAGYDPAKPHNASDLVLRSSRRIQTAGANVFLAYKDGSVYYSAAGQTAYVERIACK